MIEVITGTVKADFVGLGPVLIKLTRRERWELLKAHVKVILKGFRPSLADCMGAELESLLCGYKPERYVKTSVV